MWWSKPKELPLMPLPMNMPQFNEWSQRIIRQAGLPTENLETQQFALAGMIMQSDPTQFFRPDEYYVNCLRKAASDQLAMQLIEDLKIARAKRELMKKQSEDTRNPMGVSNGKEKEITN